MPNQATKFQLDLLSQLARSVNDHDLLTVQKLSPQINWSWINDVNTASATSGYCVSALESIYRAFSNHLAAAIPPDPAHASSFITACITDWIAHGYNPIGDQNYFQLLRSSRTDQSFCDQTVSAILGKGLTDEGVSLLSRTADQLTASRVPLDHVIESCLKHGSDPNAKSAAGVPVLLTALRRVGSTVETTAFIWDVHAPIRAARILLEHGVDVYAQDTSRDAFLMASHPNPPLLRPGSSVLDTALSWVLAAPLVAKKDPEALALLQSLSDLHTRTLIRDALPEQSDQSARSFLKM